MLTPLSKALHINGQGPATKVTVGGQFIAKATSGYPPRRRALDAARWLRGELTIKPTVRLAAQTFSVSVPLVAEAREQLEREERRARSALPLSDSAIDNIVREVGVNRVWASIDRLTQPELPAASATE
jgi:hypothetical protein